MSASVGRQQRVANWLIDIGAAAQPVDALTRASAALVECLGCAQVVHVDERSILALAGGEAPDAARVAELAGERPNANTALTFAAQGSWCIVGLSAQEQSFGRLLLRSQNASEAVELARDWRLKAFAAALAGALARAASARELEVRATQVWSILDNIQSVVFIKDLDGRYTLVNRQLLRDTGLTREQVIGKTDERLFSPEAAARIIADDRQVLASGELGEFEGVTDFPSGPRVFLTTKFPLRDSKGEIYGLCGISTDISERKRTQRAQQLDALGRLAGGVAHDVNNVLASILGSAELIEDLHPSPRAAELDTALETIETSCERAGELTAKLLQFSREAHRPREYCNLHELIDATAELLRSGNPDAHLDIQLDAPRASVFGDVQQLRAALLQLGLNARDALPGGRGRVEFTTREIELDEAHCRESSFMLLPGSYIELEVRDSGKGIAPELLPRIFEPFFTTKPTGKGTGLGLATVHAAVVSHRGELLVSSQPGEGTSVRLRLPTIDEGPGPVSPVDSTVSPSAMQTVDAAPAEEPEAEPDGPLRVLLADDEPMVRRTLKMQLRSFGLEVIEAEDGLQAVERFEQEHEHLALVVLDMLMPRLGGHEAFGRMREINPQVPVIVSTGFAPDDQVRALERQGLAGCLCKPYRRARLREALEAVLGPLDAP